MHYNACYSRIIIRFNFGRNSHGRGGRKARQRREAAIDFRTEPSRYRHWKLAADGEIATLTMDVDEKGGLLGGYELKLNSYDLGVDIELADAIERLRFEHPEVKVVIDALGQGPRVLRRRQHPHAGERDARAQGELLQVHQRDAQRHRGCERESRTRNISAS